MGMYTFIRNLIHLQVLLRPQQTQNEEAVKMLNVAQLNQKRMGLYSLTVTQYYSSCSTAHHSLMRQRQHFGWYDSSGSGQPVDLIVIFPSHFQVWKKRTLKHTAVEAKRIAINSSEQFFHRTEVHVAFN